MPIIDALRTPPSRTGLTLERAWAYLGCAWDCFAEPFPLYRSNTCSIVQVVFGESFHFSRGVRGPFNEQHACSGSGQAACESLETAGAVEQMPGPES